MAGKTFYLLPGAVAAGALLMRDMQDGGAAPAALTSGTGWTVAKTATSTPYDLMIGGTKRAAATFGATAMPNVAPVDQTTGDSFRTPTPLTGTFANAAWSIAAAAISVTAAASGAGRIRTRIWKTKSRTGDGREAHTITAAAATNYHHINQSYGTSTNGQYTLSVMAKAGTNNFAYLFISDGVSTGYALGAWDLSLGTLVRSATAGTGWTVDSTSITAVPAQAGWYVISVTGTLSGVTSGNIVAYVGVASAAGSEFWAAAGTETIVACGAQLEFAGSASTYSPSVPGAQSTTNLLGNSEDFANGTYWTTNNSSVTANNVADPFGYAVTELTAATQTGTTITSLSTSVEQASTVTWSPGTITLAGEYLFFQTAWEITTASGNTSADVVLRSNSTARVITPDFPVTFSKPLSVRQAVKRASVY